MRKNHLTLLMLILAAFLSLGLLIKEDKGYWIDTATITGGPNKNVDLDGWFDFFNDEYIIYGVFNYTSYRRIEGPCNQKLSGRYAESKGYTLSYSGSNSTQAGGSVTSGGGPTSAKATASINQTISSTWGLNLNSTETATINYECEKREGYRAFAKIEFETTEYSAVYISYNFITGSTKNEFHVYNRTIKGYECEYMACRESEPLGGAGTGE